MTVIRMAYLVSAFSWCALPCVWADQVDRYDYFIAERQMIRNGVQAVLMCNGLFTSHRTREQVFAQELRYLDDPVGTAAGGAYEIEQKTSSVVVGGGAEGTAIRAAFREGIGCVVMAPDQTVAQIPELPRISRQPPKMDPQHVDWPDGDRLPRAPASCGEGETKGLCAAAHWAFNRDTPEQVTLSLLVVHKGELVLERYAEGVDYTTRTRTWSTAKSIAVTLIGMLVREGKMSLDSPLGTKWLPELTGQKADPRDTILLRNVLNMSSGLFPVDSFGMEYATGSGLAYWAGASSVDGARRRGLVSLPGEVWEYENYDTLLAVEAMKRALGSQAAYHAFPHEALLAPIGMHNTLLSTDRFGDFILSSQVYTNARDLARFGLLYLNGGRWHDKTLISDEWIEFVRTPAPSTAKRGNFYGGQWWLVPDNRVDVPTDAYATAGNRGQYVIVVPSADLVIVRRGLDYGAQGFDRWDLTREVMRAIPPW